MSPKYSMTCYRTSQRLHQRVSLYMAIERPVLYLQSWQALGLCLSIAFPDMINRVTIAAYAHHFRIEYLQGAHGSTIA